MGHFEFQVNVGAISVGWNSDEKLTRIDWALKLLPDDHPKQIPAHVRQLVERLKRYFAEGDPLGPIPWHNIEQSGWTPFQTQVYRILSKIPHGETRTYGWVAGRLGKVTSPRAVGQALKNNPLPILIPCHRVVCVASLGGFMGIIDPNRPELDLKRWLLSLEQEYVNPPLPFMQREIAMGALR